MRKRGDGIDTLLAIPIADDVPPPPPDLSYVRKYPTLIRSLTNLSKPNMDEAAEGARAPPSIQYQNNTLYSDLIQLEQDFLRRKSERLFEGISLYIIKSPKDLPGGERDLAVQAFEVCITHFSKVVTKLKVSVLAEPRRDCLQPHRRLRLPPRRPGAYGPQPLLRYQHVDVLATLC